MTSPLDHPIADLDRHVLEPFGLWREYLPQTYWSELPELRPPSAGNETLFERHARLGPELSLCRSPALLCIGGKLAMKIPESGAIVCALAAEERQAELLLAGTGEGHLRHMDQHNMDYSMLVPTLASYFAYNEAQRPELCRAYADAYNRWIWDLCEVDRRRLKPAALLSRHDPHRCVDDLQQALALGFGQVVLRPNPVLGKTLSCPELEGFWACCAEAGVPVFLHEGSHANVVAAGSDRYQTRFGQISASHPLEMMMALLSLVEGGVLERHRSLKICILEAGAGWLPSWLWRLDEQFHYHRAELPNLARLPSEAIAEQIWIAVEPGEPGLGEVIRTMSADRLVYGSDYPHQDHPSNIAASVARLQSALGLAHTRHLLWKSPAALLGLSSSCQAVSR